MEPLVTDHAISRYQERVEPVACDEARARLSSPIIQRAIEIGAPYVKLGTGQHVVIKGNVVLTVLPRDQRIGTFFHRDRY